MSAEPPRLAALLLRVATQPDDRESLLADLAEEHEDLVARLGPRGAARWYWSQTIRSLPPCLWRRIELAARVPDATACRATPPPSKGVTMARAVQDVRFALRALRQRPQFTLVTVLTLAMGIGANTAIFSLLNGILLKPVPGLSDTAGLVEVSRDVNEGRFFDLSYPVFLHLRRESRSMKDMAALTLQPMAFGQPGAADVYMGMSVTGNYFSLLGIQPAAGRFFAPGESLYPSVTATAVISDDLWERSFGRDPSVIGRTLLLNGYPVELIGIAPPGFRGHAAALAVDVFVPMGVPAPGLHDAAALTNPESSIIEVLGRLNDTVKRGPAAAELSRLATSFMEAQTSQPQVGYVVRVEPWASIPAVVRVGVLTFLAVLMTLATLVLAMACINVAGMLLARASERRREMAIRLALGAKRGRIVRQLVTEALILFIAGGAVGLTLAIWATRLLLLFDPPLPPGFALRLDLSPDWRVFAFSLAIAAATGIIFSLAPALRSARPDLVPALRDRAAAATPLRTRFRSSLTAVQMGATLILLVGAGLFSRALRRLEAIDPGWDTSGVQVMSLDLELSGYSEERGLAFYDRLLERARALPGVVESAALARKLPLGGRSSLGDVNVVGVEPPARRFGFEAYFNTVSPDYFATMHLALLEGRDFGPADRQGAPRVAIVNRVMADRFWPTQAAVGRRFWVGRVGEGLELQVIGVVENAKYRSLVEETPNFYYLPYAQRYNSQTTLHLRTAGPAPLTALRDVMRELDPGLPVLAIRPLDEALGVFFLPQRLAAWVAGLMGFLGLALGTVGVYGVTTLAIGERRREIGIRLALGARTHQVLRLMVGRGLRAPLVGIAVGMTIAAGVTRMLSGFLAGVRPLDPLTFGGVLALLFVVALCAILVPARRAARLDPVETLRVE